MQKRIAILRGINVGGHKKILMADLKALLEKHGFQDPKTYIQSGNVVFFADEALSNEEVADKIASAIAEVYGFEVSTLVRSVEELKTAVDTNPFYTEEADIKKLHLTFLKEIPSEEHKTDLASFNFEPDLFVLKDQNIFVYCEGKYHQTKLSNGFFEKKLKVSATTRNWRTVLKLLDLASE
ncbi:MAG: DUF1697 domain-containing protein [Bacteroidota bacterium]